MSLTAGNPSFRRRLAGVGYALALLSSLAASAQDGSPLTLVPGGSGAAPSQLGLSIGITPEGTGSLGSNSAALAAFNRAADTWKNFLSDSIQINITADLVNLGSPSIIGQTSVTLVQAPYNTIRNAMVADAAGQPGNGIVASLPTAAQFSAFVPAGFTLSGNIVLSKANAKALGFTGLDDPKTFGVSDGTIEFNSAFNFDYDNSDGVTPGSIDFQTVATHEIGHLLGFLSAVDDIDQSAQPGQASLYPLDLFRFGQGAAPTTPVEFTTNPRDLRPGVGAVLSNVSTNLPLSTGLTNGDGRQASHWKDDGLTGQYVGIMDPTLAYGVIEPVTAPDLIALDLIGYDLKVPEPSTYAAAGAMLALVGGQWYRRNRRSDLR